MTLHFQSIEEKVMAKPAYLNPKEISDLANRAALATTTPERDSAAVLFLFATGVKGFEFASVELRDLMFESGKWKPLLTIRSENAFNDCERQLPIKKIDKFLSALDSMLSTQGSTEGARYRGFDPTRKLFVTDTTKAFGCKGDYQDEKAAMYGIRDLFKTICIKSKYEHASLLSGRRSFIINAHRHGVDANELMTMTGIKSKSDLLKQENSDPQSLADICNRII